MNTQLFETCFPGSLLLDINGHRIDEYLTNITSNTSNPLSTINFLKNLTQHRWLPINGSVMTNVSLLSAFGKNVTSTDDEQMLAFILRIFRSVISMFGLLGNVLMLSFLSRKRLSLSGEGADRTVHNGLTALAVSDLLFCLILVPYGFVKNDRFAFASRNFHLIYVTYSTAFVNFFILTSTWLTVVMASSRYMAICHPFRARHLRGAKGTRVSLAVVGLCSFIFNLPRLFINQIEPLECSDGNNMYLRMPGLLAANSRAHTVYIWMHFLVGILIPLTVLAFCNICLIKVLHESNIVRRQYRVSAAHIDSNYRITSILVTIVVMYIVLVSPAEILLFIQDRFLPDKTSAPALVLAVEVTNLLQMINFSSNFVLYFILNSSHRHLISNRSYVGCLQCQDPVEDPEEFFELQRLNQTGKTNIGLPSVRCPSLRPLKTREVINVMSI
ncbi:hypothetical protein LSH36_980g00019 [Paralvinella palmiformis]|uniref:G-protein coupled receptors family 1 profile domain-containing protein n=1 Tax=Paralvinella palmiformis TaxID=53620 RepID=A0AAD9IX75_9ANNE|nr:hypothetical protein LSH36_980g00019 [Paralvinella palmiformis]